MFSLLLPIVGDNMHIMARRRTGDCPVFRERKILMVNSSFFTGRMADPDGKRPFRGRLDRMAFLTKMIQIIVHRSLSGSEDEPSAQLVRRSNVADRAIAVIGMGIDHCIFHSAYRRREQQ